mmetsp:Transcript_96330/g.272403  ORF Transcript_96330/g.272403 Transcript_96330/m.272403 type:complete len:200 (+) Transcript_96330:260-859(+)
MACRIPSKSWATKRLSVLCSASESSLTDSCWPEPRVADFKSSPKSSPATRQTRKRAPHLSHSAAPPEAECVEAAAVCRNGVAGTALLADTSLRGAAWPPRSIFRKSPKSAKHSGDCSSITCFANSCAALLADTAPRPPLLGQPTPSSNSRQTDTDAAGVAAEHATTRTRAGAMPRASATQRAKRRSRVTSRSTTSASHS